MKNSKIIMSVTLASLLVLSGCGGGGSSSSSPSVEDTSVVFIEKPTNTSETLKQADSYHQKIATGFLDNSSLILKKAGLIDIAVEIQNTTSNDSRFITLTEQYDKELAILVKQNAQLLIDAINLQTLHANSTYTQSIFDTELDPPGGGLPGMFSTTLRNGDNETIVKTPQKRFVVATAIGVGLLAYSFSKLFKTGGEALVENSRNNILNIAATDDAGRKEIIALMRKQGVSISDNASVSQIDKEIGNITVNNLATISRNGLKFAHNDPLTYLDVFESARELMPNTIRKIGRVAVESVVTGNSSVTGSVGSLIADKKLGVVVDVVTTVSSTDPLSLINSHVSTTAVSKDTEEVNVEPTTMTLSEAKTIVSKLAKEGAGNIKVSDLENSQKAITADLAKNDGDGKDNVLSVPVYATTQSYTLEEQEKTQENNPNKESGTLKIYEEYQYNNMEIMITNGKEIDHTITNVVPALNSEVIIQIQLNLARSMDISTKELSSDENSITYQVSVNVKGVYENMNVSIDVSNASTTSSTKTLNKDGTVTWTVIVLDKDATVSITRSDTGASESVSLKGTGVISEPAMGNYDRYAILALHYTCYNSDDIFPKNFQLASNIGIIDTTPYSDVASPSFGYDSLSGYISDDYLDIVGSGTLYLKGTITSGVVSGRDSITNYNHEYCEGSYTGYFADEI